MPFRKSARITVTNESDIPCAAFYYYVDWQKTLLKGWEALKTAKHADHPLEVQRVGGVVDGKQLWFRPAEPEAWLEVPFTADKAETVELVGTLVHSWDYGTYRVTLDGKEIAKHDLYSPNVVATTHRWGVHKLEAGPHVLRFECVGKSAESKGYLFGFGELSARIPVYSRDASVDLRSIQKE